MRLGAVVLLDGFGNVLGTAFLSGVGMGGLGVLVPGNVLPVAGDGGYAWSNDGTPALDGSLNLPSGVALDGAGNLYIADRLHNRIRMVCASATSATILGTGGYCTGAGIITTTVGNGAPADSGDGLAVTDPTVTINSPWGVTVDGAGNLYIADTGNNKVRKVTAATGIISTVAGTGTAGYNGEGSPAASYQLNQPQGVSVDAGGNLYIADTYNHRIRRVDAQTGTISTVAGNGTGGYLGDSGQATSAELDFPFAVAFDSAGNMYIPDSANNVVREVAAVGGVITASSIITTIAGTPPPAPPGFSGDGQAATLATLSSPSGVAVDPAGNVYIADTQNSSIRKVNAVSGIISTITQWGDGTYVIGGVAPFFPVTIYGPVGLYLDSRGNLYFADVLNMMVRMIQSNFVALNFATGTPPVTVGQGNESVPLSQNVENDGNAPLDLTVIAPDENAAVDVSLTTCTTGSPFLAVDDDCAISAQFAPSTNVPPTTGEIGNIYVGKTGDTISAPLDIELIGNTTLVLPTSTVVTATPSTTQVLTPIQFTAVVTGNNGVPSGPVTFIADGVAMGSAVNLNATGTATFTYAGLAVGTHQITASYAGDSTNLPSVSAAISVTVSTIPTVTGLAVSAASGSSTMVLLAAVLNNGGTATPVPTGTVTFSNGSTTIGSATLDSSGVATFTSNLGMGNYTLIAVYSGDAFHAPSTSQAVTITGTPISFNLAATPTTISMASTQNTTLTVTLSSEDGFADTIELGCASIPPGISCTFTPQSVALKANGVVTSQLVIDTNSPLTGGATAKNSRPGDRESALAGLLLPFSGFFGLVLWRLRRRHAGLFSTLAVVVLSGAAMLATGCNGIGSSSVSPGTYVIQVTGIGANSSQIHYQNVTVTITK